MSFSKCHILALDHFTLKSMVFLPTFYLMKLCAFSQIWIKVNVSELEGESITNPEVSREISWACGARFYSFLGQCLATVLDAPRQWVIQDYLGIGRLGQWNVCLTYFSFFHWFMVSVLGFQGRNHERHKEVTGIWSRRWCLHVVFSFIFQERWFM